MATSMFNMLALMLLVCHHVLAADGDAWRSRNIYFALTDRFAKSDNNDTRPCQDLHTYCGGTFVGLESKLDYIKGMGFDAIWINPVVKNSPDGYHGYWAQDLFSINHHFGTADELHSLVEAAHSKGFFMMLDVVANHMGNREISYNQPFLMKLKWSFHQPCDIDYTDQWSIENCQFAKNTLDVNTQNEMVRFVFYDWVHWIVQNFSFDGLRIDTVKHVEKDFWPGFVNFAGVFSMGEVLDGRTTYVAPYQDVVPGILNYPMYFTLNKVYQGNGGFQDLVDMHDNIGSAFADATLLGTFIDNHDNSRFLAQKNDISLLKNALAYVILARGIPIVYYGTEQGFTGAVDPDNREALWSSNYDTNSNLYQTIAKLSAARKVAGGLGADDHKHLYVVQDGYAWSRADGALIVFTTNKGAGSSGTFCFGAQTPSGTNYIDVLHDATNYTVDGIGNICVSIFNGEPVVLQRQ